MGKVCNTDWGNRCTEYLGQKPSWLNNARERERITAFKGVK
jgi:hypothetical protein